MTVKLFLAVWRFLWKLVGVFLKKPTAVTTTKDNERVEEQPAGEVASPSYLIDQYDGVMTFSCKADGDMALSKNFKVKEFRCQDGTDEILIDMALVRYLQQIRDWAGGSITVSSGYRTPSHNKKVGGSKNSKHMQGKAADIVCSTKTPLELARKAQCLNIPGIEWNPVKHYTHVDTRTGDDWWRQYAEDSKGKGYFIKIKSFYDVEEEQA